MSESTNKMLREHLESTRESLAELWAAIDHGDTYDDSCPECRALAVADECEQGEAFSDKLSELPLEIVWEKGEPFAVVLGTGGPHIEIRGGGRHDGMGYALHGYWSSEHVVIRGESITRTGEYFRELVEETDQ